MMKGKKALRKLFVGDKIPFVDKENHIYLDLTYITDRIVAMGYPTSDKIRKYVRNNAKEVAVFLQTYHAKKFMIFNLALEMPYDFAKFDNRVMCFGINDHCAPPLEELVRAVLAIDEWLKADPENCAFIHCKAGRGRTGTVISSYLLWSKQISTETDKDPVKSALNYFAGKRSKKEKGVMVPSQRRYVNYFYHLMNTSIPIPLNRKLLLNGIVLSGLPNDYVTGLNVKISDLCVVPSKLPIIIPNPLRHNSPFQKLTNGDLLLSFSESTIILEGDVMMTFRLKRPVLTKTKTTRLFRFAFHTAFVNANYLELDKSQLDGPYANYLSDSKIPPKFNVKLMFGDVADLTQPLSGLPSI